MLDGLYQHYSKAKSVLGIDPHTKAEEDMFSNTAKKIIWMKSLFEGRCGPEGITPSRAPNIEMPDMDFVNNNEFIDLLDDQWMRDLMAPFEQ